MLRPDAKTSSIVLLGNFNPSIFHPQWFASHNVISKSEADNESNLNISSPKITNFSLSWANIQITPEQFIINCSNPTLFTMLQDFVLKSFTILEHTPLTAMGINLEQKFFSPNEQAHQRFGDNLAPKKKWDFMKNPGLRDFVMEDQKRNDRYSGYVQARIRALREERYSIMISVNDHYHIPNYMIKTGANPIMEILRNNWEASNEKSGSIINDIVRKFS